MNSRPLRRLAADHSALHTQPLPPNYLFPADSSADDLTHLDILLAGPTHTPFSAGVWKLHLTLPDNYPQAPPTAHFRTPIFHPNVEPQTGGVCVETLKRDWDPKLTLRDVLVTICCLLIQPNPDSALNAEAGGLIQENYEAFARRAELMTSIHAVVSRGLREAVREAQMRGQEVAQEEEVVANDDVNMPAAPARRRRPTVRQRGTAPIRRSDGSPTGGMTRRRQPEQNNPFIVQTRNDDVFGEAIPSRNSDPPIWHDDDNSILIDADQENDETRSPKKAKAPKVGTPKRPTGAPVPLGELTLDEPSSSELEDSMDAEYPPSPKKLSSPTKSPAKKRPQLRAREDQPESSRDAAARNITPTTNPFTQPLAHDSPYTIADPSTSPRKGGKTRMLQETPKRAPLFPSLSTPREYGGIFKPKSPSSAEKKVQERRRKQEMERNLWKLCGGDVGRWNRGDFGGQVFEVKGGRW